MTETPTLDATLADIVSKAADALEKATAQYGPDAVGLALEVGRIAAIKDVASGLLSVLLIYVIYRTGRWVAPIAAKGMDHRDEIVAMPSFFGLIIGGLCSVVFALLLLIEAFTKLTAIHAWVGMFRPEIYLAYEAIF